MAIYKLISNATSYKVSNDNSIWSKKSGAWRKLKPRRVGAGANRKKWGRPQVCLFMDNGSRRENSVAQLVALYFIGPKPNGAHVLHKDDDRNNNNASNLYYGDDLQNSYDKGDNSGPIGRADVVAIRASDLSDIVLGRYYGVNRKTIWSIKNYRSWTDI